MADSIAEKIIANIKTTLEGITVANGYLNTQQKVTRGDAVLMNELAFPGFEVLEPDETFEQAPAAGPNALLTVFMELPIRGWILLVRGDKSKTLGTLIQDTLKAMMVDQTRGGLAVATDPVSVETWIVPEENQPKHFFVAIFRVHYRHRRTDPTVVG